MLGGSWPLTSKRALTEPTNTPRLLKRPRSEHVGVIRAPKKLEVYLQVKRNYLFHVRMARLIETLISEMVKQREAEERMAAVLERLMKWVEETELESDGEGSEKVEFGEEEE